MIDATRLADSSSIVALEDGVMKSAIVIKALTQRFVTSGSHCLGLALDLIANQKADGY